jgi:archaeal flagellar protein FlaD
MLGEIVDGLKSKLKKGGGAMDLPPPGGIPPEPPMPPADAPMPTPSQDQPPMDDFTTLLAGSTNELDEKVKKLEEKSDTLESKVHETLDTAKKSQERLDEIDQNMKKFLSLYELVTNQINPFVDQGEPVRSAIPKLVEEVEKDDKIFVPEEVEEPEPAYEEPALEKPEKKEKQEKKEEEPAGENIRFLQTVSGDRCGMLLEWRSEPLSKGEEPKLPKHLLDGGWITQKAYDTISERLNMSGSQGISAPPQILPKKIDTGVLGKFMTEQFGPQEDPQSLEEVLEWIKYLVDKVGPGEATEILKYIVELGWVTPDAHKALINYIENSSPIRAHPKAPQPEKPEEMEKIAVTAIPPSPKAPDMSPQPEIKISLPVKVEPKHEPPKRKPKEVIPIKEIGSDIESVAITLEWIRYLAENAGTEGAKKTFNYYREIGWITDEVHKQLMKYMEGIKNVKTEISDYQPTVEDHTASLFYIGKLKKTEVTEDDIQEILGG